MSRELQKHRTRFSQPADPHNDSEDALEKSRPELNQTFVSPHADGTCISIKLQPRAAKTSISGVAGNELKVSVPAPPVDGAANEALLRFLAERLDCPRSNLQLIRGNTSRHKVVLVHGLKPTLILPRLAPPR